MSCTNLPKGLTLLALDVACKIVDTDDTKITLAKAAMRRSFEKLGITHHDVQAAVIPGGGVHLEADTRTVFEKILQKSDDIKDDLQGQIDRQTVHINMLMRWRSLSVAAAAINALIRRILLQPLQISDDLKPEYFQHLVSHAATRAEASHRLAASGVNMSLDDLLRFRETICKPRNQDQHDLADSSEEFAEYLNFLPPHDISDADKALLAQMHARELAASRGH